MAKEEDALDQNINHKAAVEVLSTGQLTVLGRMPWSSNMTFLVDVHLPSCPTTCSKPQADLANLTPAKCTDIQGIYKPVRGERPLRDFPTGLHTREIAAFRLSHELRWNLVPPTVMRDGPMGEGSVQLFVPANYKEHYFTLHKNPAHHQWLQRLCAYDFVINSTDRKAGHILLATNDKLYAIDNGLSFHNQFKLRTVIWDWAGHLLPDNIAQDISRLLDNGVPDEVAELLSVSECEALQHRAKALVQSKHFPSDPNGYHHPWPLI
ncbi:MAG: SCO1664 family protein [Acidimicrobiia bacterium]|nr:SCO1664 family protein [Acidimicrobiia bacterium]MYC57145.1 SCO1664 family protein [Acidimicrobiia bacterium]MYI29931.1 SCO1664 family protein [Acidimicrobiia bacterium]